VRDLITCIGDGTYPGDKFIEEAASLGISRRGQPRMPEGIIYGQTRVWCVFESEHDSHLKLCPVCEKKLPKVEPPYPDEIECPGCHLKHQVTRAKAGKVRGYFVPDAMELVLRTTDQEAEDALALFETLGVAKVVRTGGKVRVTLVRPDLADAITCLKGVSDAATILKAHMTRIVNGQTQIVLVTNEADRGCGQRKHGGVYLTSPTGSQSPFVPVPDGIEFDAQSFRGFKMLPEFETGMLRAYSGGGLVVHGRETAPTLEEVLREDNQA
jgi:hypothetical protein